MENRDNTSTLYLGTRVNPITGNLTDQPLLYESKNLATHAVCVGMTGSGKTGLGIALLEEAGLDKIPAIIIDPKGDLSNLLLTFPHLSGDEFLPWIDPLEAGRKGISVSEYAEETSKMWQEGLDASHEEMGNIQKLKNSVEMVIYTPANTSGTPISILHSFAAPSVELREDSGAFRDRIQSLASTLLGLLGMNADPLKSREHILISSIIDFCWSQGKNLNLIQLIQYIQKPPFEKIGALDMETFFPTKDRANLAINLNNLLAAPGFQAWMEGDPLEIQNLFYTAEGKPKFSIFSIAHLSESERMFFVTLLLNEMISWMRQQPGTSNLRALLYMDEIFGYFPPSAMPPSKTPMLLLLKQARAYGLGIVLATQNPADLDYKGLANCGTWFIGRLQTDRDKMRVIEGLKASSNGDLDSEMLDQLLANIGKRIFLMRSVYESKLILFKTRWTLSYLRGPLTLAQIQKLKKPSSLASEILPLEHTQTLSSFKPVLSSTITELFAKRKESLKPIRYTPRLLGIAKLHFVDSKNKIDAWKDVSLVAPTDDEGQIVLWEEGNEFHASDYLLTKDISSKDRFDELPTGLMQSKNYASFE
ncbi:MAG: ATP-binding protein, partial [Parachlamydiaceae bacterium]